MEKTFKKQKITHIQRQGSCTYNGEKQEKIRAALSIKSTTWFNYSETGFLTAIDDFGAGYAGLNLLAEYQPHIIKLDRQLIIGIHDNYVKQVIVDAIIGVCSKLGMELLAEGVELEEEYHWLHRAGISLFQGYYFARPGFECLPQLDMALLTA